MILAGWENNCKELYWLKLYEEYYKTKRSDRNVQNGIKFRKNEMVRIHNEEDSIVETLKRM